MVRVQFKIRVQHRRDLDELFLFGDGHELGEWNIQKVVILIFV